jgi:hypothetical protein
MVKWTAIDNINWSLVIFYCLWKNTFRDTKCGRWYLNCGRCFLTINDNPLSGRYKNNDHKEYVVVITFNDGAYNDN